MPGYYGNSVEELQALGLTLDVAKALIARSKKKNKKLKNKLKKKIKILEGQVQKSIKKSEQLDKARRDAILRGIQSDPKIKTSADIVGKIMDAKNMISVVLPKNCNVNLYRTDGQNLQIIWDENFYDICYKCRTAMKANEMREHPCQ